MKYYELDYCGDCPACKETLTKIVWWCNKEDREFFAPASGFPEWCPLYSSKNEDIEYEYAKDLITAVWEKHYKDIVPEWEPCDNLMGVLTQIDNMLTGLQPTKPSSPETAFSECP